MQTFRFILNRSFLAYPWHPITVPRTQVSYRALQNELGHVREGRLRFPDGSSVAVRLNRGFAGWGEYYQLKSQGESTWLRTCAHVGRAVTVAIRVATNILEVLITGN
jgi:hypothetical protein